MRKRAFVVLNRVLNNVIARVKPRRFRGGDLLLLTTTGRKTGKQRTTPVLYLADGERWIVVASNGGADWEPGWWLNLRGGGTGMVEVNGTRTTVRGTEVDGQERKALAAVEREGVRLRVISTQGQSPPRRSCPERRAILI